MESHPPSEILTSAFIGQELSFKSMIPRFLSYFLFFVLINASTRAGSVAVSSEIEVPDIGDFTISSVTVDFMLGTGSSINDQFFIFLTNGAEFNSTITASNLMVTGSAAFDLVTGNTLGAATLEFKYTSAGMASDVYTFNLDGVRITNGSSPISIDARTDDSYGAYDNYTADVLAVQASAVPEPSSFAFVLGLATLGFSFSRRRRVACLK